MSDSGIIFGVAVAAGVAGAFASLKYRRLKIGDSAAQRLTILMILIWSALVGTMAVLKHLAFKSGAYDLGIFDQFLWNMAHGQFSGNTVNADQPAFLGNHFSPILVILVPLYWIYPNPSILVASQALIIASAGLPIFWMGRDVLRSQGLALALVFAYLIHPATAYIALFDFHEIALATPLLGLALYFLLRGRDAYFAVALFLAFLVKEDIGLIGAATGLFILFAQRRRIAGLSLFIVGIAWTLVLISYVMPNLRPSGTYRFANLSASLGSSLDRYLVALVVHPDTTLNMMLATSRLAYFQQMLTPLGFLPLLGLPVLIIILPPLLELVLSDNLPNNLIQYQYSASILPALLAASIMGLSFVRNRAGPTWTKLAPGLGVFSITAATVGAYLYGPLPFARHFSPQDYQSTPRLEVARELIAEIPPEASVVAQSNLVPQLSQRAIIQVFNFADPTLRPDYYFLDTDKEASRFPLQQDDDWNYFKSVARVQADAEYRLVENREGYLLFKHDNSAANVGNLGDRIKLNFGDEIRLEAYNASAEPLSAGDTLTVTLYWRAERKMTTNYTLFAQLLDANGKKWGQHDDYPTSEYLPTSEWEDGLLYRTEWRVLVDRDTPAGDYHLMVGLYDITTMQRLLARGGDSGAARDQIDLGPIRVR